MNGVKWRALSAARQFLKEEVGIALWAKKAFQTKDFFVAGQLILIGGN